MMAALTVDFLIGLAQLLKPNALRVLSQFKYVVTWIRYLLDNTIVIGGWALMVNGGLTALDFCGPIHYNTIVLSNCVAHSVTGLAFLGQGIFWLVMLQQVGRSWLSRTGRSPDFYDSLHFLFWGAVNTMAEHDWLRGWNMLDIEHTSNGILFLTGGLLSLWLTWPRPMNRPVRSPIFAICLFISGWTFTWHPQKSMWSTRFHTAIGYTMMILGVTKILETTLILKDRLHLPAKEPVDSFQYIPILV
jgi:hypothetical protein